MCSLLSMVHQFFSQHKEILKMSNASDIARELINVTQMEGETDTSMLMWIQREYSKLMKREAIHMNNTNDGHSLEKQESTSNSKQKWGDQVE
tara:strand:+ start:338 stop:613 length:276 start_codon:yes stop_codon:yes gene_type:complete